MILKSYEVEKNFSKLKSFRSILIYGENIGLKETIKKNIAGLYKNAEIIKIFQEDISKNKEVVKDEILNVSLFSEQKIIFINQANDKVINDIEYFLEHNNNNLRIILFADILDKKSKIRSLFEKKKDIGIIPCYNDTDITLKILVQKELGEYKNVNANIINMIINYSNLNRKTILNNLDKLKVYFVNKIIDENGLETILNTDRNEVFENIRDAALDGEKANLNKLLNNFVFNNEETFSYLNIINYRLLKLLDIQDQITIYKNVEVAIGKVKPPIFWKDKPVFLKLLKKWDKTRVINAINYLGEVEARIKNNSQINSLALVKNSILNICSNSWAYF